MKYAFLIYTEESKEPAPGSPEFGEILAGYGAFGELINKDGAFLAGEPLQPVATASTVSVRDGKRTVTDGPFAETKEQLGGFYVLECANLDAALAYAEKIPGAHAGRIEVRPVLDLSGG